jgi:energy-converting hydrogenase Eha subunit C
MSSGVASLHKILKDETRRRIILLMRERESLSYVDLMKALGIANTGKMNYHLKILGDLVTKTQDGKYTLTEKGILTSRLLLEFPEKSQSQIEAGLPLGLVIGASLLSAVYITVALALYSLRYIDFARMVTNVFAAISAVILLIVAGKARKRRAEWAPRRQMLGAKIAFMAFGAWGGAVVGFFGGGLLLIGLIALLRSNGVISCFSPFAHEFSDFTFWVLNPILGAVVVD